METTYWICDICNEKINCEANGYVEWRSIGKNTNKKEIKIVHDSADCQLEGDGVSSRPLIDFSGNTGLMELLEYVSTDEFNNIEENLELIKRIHMPGYEEARPYFARAIREDVPGVADANTKHRYYSQDVLKQIINTYS